MKKLLVLTLLLSLLLVTGSVEANYRFRMQVRGRGPMPPFAPAPLFLVQPPSQVQQRDQSPGDSLSRIARTPVDTSRFRDTLNHTRVILSKFNPPLQEETYPEMQVIERRLANLQQDTDGERRFIPQEVISNNPQQQDIQIPSNFRTGRR